MRIPMLATAVFLALSPAQAEDAFTCPFLKKPACLSSNESVYNSLFDKAVNRRAFCFDQYACGIRTTDLDFVCKSAIQPQVDQLADAFNNVKFCVQNATSLEEAKTCIGN
jgi:hypothetical protein